MSRTGNGAIINAGQLLGLAAQTYAFSDKLGNSFRIKVDIGDGSEEAVDHETIDFLVLGTICSGFVGPECDAFHGVNQQVLQGGYIRLFAADTDRCTAGSFGCLLTLVTKH